MKKIIILFVLVVGYQRANAADPIRKIAFVNTPVAQDQSIKGCITKVKCTDQGSDRVVEFYLTPATGSKAQSCFATTENSPSGSTRVAVYFYKNQDETTSGVATDDLRTQHFPERGYGKCKILDIRAVY
jgi:hypothetical protein